MGVCGVEMMQVDYIFRGETLSISGVIGHHSERYPRALSTQGLAEWPRPFAGSRSGIPRSRLDGDPDQLQTRHGPIYINPPALTILAVVFPCPTSLTKSLSCTHTAPGLHHASGYYDHWCTRSHQFSCLSHQAHTHAPISEHPELVISYVFLRKHVQ